jgi:WD40 repeat protein
MGFSARIVAGITQADSRSGIAVVDVGTGKTLLSVSDPGQDKGPDALGFVMSSDGIRLAAMVARGKRHHVQLWDVPGAKRLWEVAMPADWTPRNLVLTDDGRVIAGYTDLISLDGATGKLLARWDLVKSEVLPIDESSNTHLYPSRDGQTLGFVIQNVGIFLVDSRTGKLIRRLETAGEVHWPLVFNADGSRFATSNAFGDTDIRIWNTTTGKLHARLEGSPSRILAIAFSPDGRRLLSGSTDGTTLVWDTARTK